jgi:glucose-1-phosphate cytidylyltransferase
MTGGRVKLVAPYIGGETFLLTYGDGVADINIADLVRYHRSKKKEVTVTATQPSGRFGSLNLSSDDIVSAFQEKPAGDGSWINGGFFVCEPRMLDRIADDTTVLEKEPLEGLARDAQLAAFRHPGFWQPMDTLRDKIHLEGLWTSGHAPWKVW